MATLAAPVAASLLAAAYVDAKTYFIEDLGKGRGLIDVKLTLASNNRKDQNSIFYVFERTAAKRGDAQCYVCEGQSLSWKDVELEVRRIAHYFLSLGLKRGDVLALYMPNKPAYPIVWLACLAIDIVPAFINYNLTGQGLQHCIKVGNCSAVLYESDYSEPISDIADTLLQTNPSIKFVRWQDGFTSGSEKSQGLPNEILATPEVLAQMSTERIPHEYRKGITWQSPACLIYTSGTTGNPKAAIVTHGRSNTAFTMWPHINKFDKHSRIFTCMPLYHSTASLLAVGAAWNSGSTVIIGRKFSASSFWNEVRAGDANVIQYVGEILRYLLAVPPSPLDKKHNVKVAYGNGCRPDVWNKFRDRFGVRTISEFFASSEGNGSLYNFNSNNFGAGAVGHEGKLGGWVRRKDQLIVKVDSLTEDPARDNKGFCVRADPDEDGELICKIVMDSPFQAFAGYHGNKEGTEKKILRNVLEKGDAYFRTGDLLRQDKEGFTYFSDRLGDTFRWKSENVATTQVAEALGAVVDEANVYGVVVPGHEGRAGCAAIPVTSLIDFERLATHVAKTLPKYAQPLFVRVVAKMESTGTAKQLKVALRTEGVDPNVVKDPVHWLVKGKYQPFKKSDWEALKAGAVKL